MAEIAKCSICPKCFRRLCSHIVHRGALDRSLKTSIKAHCMIAYVPDDVLLCPCRGMVGKQAKIGPRNFSIRPRLCPESSDLRSCTRGEPRPPRISVTLYLHASMHIQSGLGVTMTTPTPKSTVPHPSSMHYFTQVVESELPGQLILVNSGPKRNQQNQQIKFLLQLHDFEEKVRPPRCELSAVA